MDATPPPLPPEPFKNRRTGLIVFGLLTVLLGALCALFIPAALLGASAQPGGSVRMALPSVVVYGLLAVSLVWLGIGSMLRRRWARVLLLMLSWLWLLTGIGGLAVTVFVMPGLFAALPMPEGAGVDQSVLVTAMMAIMLGIVLVGFVLLPVCWILFYRSRHVKATCEAENPAPSWVDSCPPQALALSLGLAAGVPLFLIVPVAYGGLCPFFGLLLDGVAGSVLCVIWAAAFALAARETFRRRPLGWGLTLALTLLLGASTFFTYERHGAGEIVRRMGLSEPQLSDPAVSSLMDGRLPMVSTVIFTVAMAGYLFYVRRFFVFSSGGESSESPR